MPTRRLCPISECRGQLYKVTIPMKRNRVLVTGVALISALALDAKTHFQRLLNGESGVRLSMRPEFQDYPARLEARVMGFDRHLWIQNRTLRKLLSENAAHCVAAAGQLLEDAGVTSCDPLLQQCGLYIGSPAINIDPEVFIPALKESLGSIRCLAPMPILRTGRPPGYWPLQWPWPLFSAGQPIAPSPVVTIHC